MQAGYICILHQTREKENNNIIVKGCCICLNNLITVQCKNISSCNQSCIYFTQGNKDFFYNVNKHKLKIM